MIFQELSSQANQNSWALGVDSSTHVGSLSFFNDKGLIKEISWGLEKRHSESLILDFHDNLKSLNLNLKDLSQIYIGIGPGSFTGVRVSCAFIKTLVYSLKTDLFAFPSLRILASTIKEPLEEFIIATPSIGSLVFATNYRLEDGLFVETIYHKTKDLQEILDQSKSHVFLNHNFKEKFVNFNSSKLHFTKFESDSLFKSISFSYKNKLSFCNSTHLDLQPLYLRQSEAEEKYVSTEGR